MNQKNKKNKKPKKMKKAPNGFFRILRFFLRPMLALKYKFKFDKSTSKGIKRPCLILSNHQTSFDQFAVGVGFTFGINFVASDTIFSHGLGSWLMKVLTRPIPFTKGTSDPTAVKNMMQVAKDGGAIGIFPEGNRSYFGETMTVQPGTGRLAKRLGIPLVLCNIHGGYLTKSRWKPKPNKGKCTARVVRTLSTEELKNLTDEEVQKIIEETLYVNEFTYNAQHKIAFCGKNKADNLEGILFYCPACRAWDSLYSSGHTLTCRECGFGVCIDEYGFFNPLEGQESAIPYPETILKWSQLQLEHVTRFDFSPYTDTPIFTDAVGFSKAVRTKKQVDRVEGTLELFNNRLRICGQEFTFDAIRALNVQHTRKLFIYTAADTYVADIPLKHNLVKYMICANHLKRQQEGKPPYYGY